MEWYIKAADKRDHSAMEKLSIFYDYGKGGLKKSAKKAFQWYKKIESARIQIPYLAEIDLDELLKDIDFHLDTNE